MTARRACTMSVTQVPVHQNHRTTILQPTCNSEKMVVQNDQHTRLSTGVPLLTQQPCSFFNYYEMAIDFRLGMRQEMRGKSYVHLENTQGKN